MPSKWQADLNSFYAYVRYEQLAPLRITIGAAVAPFYVLILNFELTGRGNPMLPGAICETVSQLADSLDFVKPSANILTDSAALTLRWLRIVAKSSYKLHHAHLSTRFSAPPAGWTFTEFYIRDFYENLSGNSKMPLKSDDNIGHFTVVPRHVYIAVYRLIKQNNQSGSENCSFGAFA